MTQQSNLAVAIDEMALSVVTSMRRSSSPKAQEIAELCSVGLDASRTATRAQDLSL